jgi:hypothetical protein
MKVHGISIKNLKRLLEEQPENICVCSPSVSLLLIDTKGEHQGSIYLKEDILEVKHEHRINNNHILCEKVNCKFNIELQYDDKRPYDRGCLCNEIWLKVNDETNQAYCITEE